MSASDKHRVGLIIGVVAAAALLILGWKWLRRGASVHQLRFVLPDGYRGVFVLAADPSAPAVFPERDNTYVYVIPASGQLNVRTLAPLEQWHSTSAVSTSGAPIPAAQTSPAEPYSGEVRLHHLVTDSAGRSYFLVGTDAEAVQASKRGPPFSLGGGPERSGRE
jgi:hypothetical protein